MKLSLEQARILLCSLEDSIQSAVIRSRDESGGRDFAEIAAVTEADTIYQVDKISEEAISEWFEKHWPAEVPVQVVMEGVEDSEPLVFPHGKKVSDTEWKCILDPIDGTRNIMYDKRSAWILGGLAPQKGPKTNLSDIVVAAMTELPTSKHWAADQISGTRGGGREGLVMTRRDLRTGQSTPIHFHLSGKTDCRHGFSSISRFFPEGKGLLGAMEEELWKELYGENTGGSPLVFDDQYISTGGQMYEILVGHDRFLADLRPLVFAKLKKESALVCHPYDICTSILLQEGGAIVEKIDGTPLDAPLDTTSPVAWVAYANAGLAAHIRPVLQKVAKKYLF